MIDFISIETNYLDSMVYRLKGSLESRLSQRYLIFDNLIVGNVYDKITDEKKEKIKKLASTFSVMVIYLQFECGNKKINEFMEYISKENIFGLNRFCKVKIIDENQIDFDKLFEVIIQNHSLVVRE